VYLPPAAQGDVYRAANERPFAIGIVEAVSTLFIATEYRDMVVFTVLIAILLMRPWGLFGVRVRGDA